MPPRRRGASGFRGVRVRPSGRFTAEIRAGGFRLTLGTYNTPELAARAYDAAAWRFRRPHASLSGVESADDPRGIPPAFLGRLSSSIGVRGRSPGMRRTVCLLGTSTRPAVGYGGTAGLCRASWTTSRPAISPPALPSFEPRAPPDSHDSSATTAAT
ncbi:hypothetical protein QYE76_071485 [Lolium multiflorum]|uniref:AP2/ERF domain-containing protein n=1 Tax=Lolium multiflorum TaxID=4521 RepID=A0AAD8SJV7_LOLMU|nr:hypothetical protein QYE76_071485 [Lolium multiflorum]